MQRVWVVVLSVWAMLAIVAVLAWSSRPVASPPPASSQTVKVVKGPGGKQRLVVLQGAGARDDRNLGGGARMSALHRTEWRAVGTTCAAAVTAGPHDESEARRALGAAQEEVAACERELSRFDPASDLSRLNAAGGRWTPIGRRLLEALGLALRAREETDGRFDPTVLPALAAAGYDRSFELLEEREARVGAMAGAPARRSRSTRGTAARGSSPASSVDLGGIGKGYAAGRALDAMRAAWPDHCRRARRPGRRHRRLAASRPKAAHGWSPSPIRAVPARRSHVLALDSGGVATSGRDARRFGPARSLHHLIDPETGESALAGPLTVTVVAPDPAAAEVHATTLAIAGLGRGRGARRRAGRGSPPLYVPHAAPPIPLGPLPLASRAARREGRMTARARRLARRARRRPRGLRPADAVGLARPRR